MRRTALFALLLGLAACAPAAFSHAAPPGVAGVSNVFAPSRTQRLFVSDTFYGYGSVLIFDYPSGKFVERLPDPPEGLIAPAGECKDAGGNVYIVNAGASTIDEYTGQGNYLRSLDDLQEEPINCSVSSSSGDLAVVNSVSNSGYPASISIFRDARGAPQVISSPYFFTISSLSYDGTGNIFFDGSQGPVGTDRYGEIPNGKTSMKVVHLSRDVYPERLQFANDRMAIGSLHRTVYRAKNRVIVGSTVLRDRFETYYIAGDRLLTLSSPKKSEVMVRVYKYPAGSLPISSIALQYSFGRDSPVDIVLSR